MKIEVTNHRSSSNLISVIVDGKCIHSRFIKPYPESVLTTHIDVGLDICGNDLEDPYFCEHTPKKWLKPTITFKKYAPPPALPSPS